MVRLDNNIIKKSRISLVARETTGLSTGLKKTRQARFGLAEREFRSNIGGLELFLKFKLGLAKATFHLIPHLK